MHTDLSPHLHTPECNKIIEELQSCHENNTFGKFIGVCNSIDANLVKCLKGERIARATANRLKSAERNERIRQRVSERQQERQ